MNLILKLDTFDKVKKFTCIANTFSSDIDIKRGRCVIDGKSMIGLYTMDFTKPVIATIHSNSEAEIGKFKEAMEEFVQK